MTRALDTAIAKLTTLPAEEQDRIAQWLLDELGDEEYWTRQFAASQDALGRLADEARAERRVRPPPRASVVAFCPPNAAYHPIRVATRRIGMIVPQLSIRARAQTCSDTPIVWRSGNTCLLPVSIRATSSGAYV